MGYCPVTLSCSQVSAIHLQGAPSACPTNDISIELKIWPKLGVHYFKICLTNHNEILHTLQQLHCCDVWEILLRLVGNMLNQSTTNYDRILKSIEISLVGWAPVAPILTCVAVIWLQDSVPE